MKNVHEKHKTPVKNVHEKIDTNGGMGHNVNERGEDETLFAHSSCRLEKSVCRKPLLLLGARQVGKTWLMQEFAREQYRNVVYVRFDRDARMKESFERDYDMKRILTSLQLHAEAAVVSGETLIILDEIQECQAALTSLKYFCEDLPEQHVVAAGSLLGLYEHSGTGFPVGKVNMMHLYPMSYTEFWEACGQSR